MLLTERINMKKFGIFILVLFSFLLLSGCNDKLVVNGVTIEKYQIHTELQEQFLTGDYNLVSTIATGAEELSYPNPITLDLKKLSKYKLTKEQKKELKELGINRFDRSAVKEYLDKKAEEKAQAEEQAKKEAEEKAKADRLANPTTEDLLKKVVEILEKKA